MKIKGRKDIEAYRATALEKIDLTFINWHTATMPQGIFSQIYQDKVSEARRIRNKTGDDIFYYVSSVAEADIILTKDFALKKRVSECDKLRLAAKKNIRDAKHIPDIDTIVSNFILRGL